MCKTKKKNSAYHPNHVIIYSSLVEKIFHEDSSISMSSDTCTNIYSKKVTLHLNRNGHQCHTRDDNSNRTIKREKISSENKSHKRMEGVYAYCAPLEREKNVVPAQSTAMVSNC